MNIKYFLFTVLFVISIPAHASEWYEGGTLHNAEASQWHKSSAHNKVATAADFIVKLEFSSNMEQLKQRAFELSICITEATSEKSLMSMKITDVAVLCVVQLGYNK